MKLTPPFGASDKNFSVYSTRKRKSDFLEKQCYNKPKSDGISEPFRGSQRDNSAYLLPRESNSQHNARTFSGRNVCGSALGMVSNQNLHFMDSRNEGSQLDNCQLYDLNNNISISLQTNDGNNQGAVVGTLNNTLGNAQFLSFLHNGSSPSPLLKSPDPEIPLLPVMQLQAQDMVIQNDHNIQSYSRAHNAPVEKDHTHFSLKSHTSFSLKSGLIFEQRNHFLSGNSSQKLFSSPSDSLKSSQVLHKTLKMESAALTIPLSTISKTLKLSPNPIFHRHFSKTPPNPSLQTRFSSICSRTRCFSPADLHKSREWFLISFAGMLFQNPSSTAPISSRLAHISSSASARAFGSGGGGDGVGGGSGGGGGDGGSNGGGSEARSVGGEADAVSAGSPDVIILDVGGMTCGGCAASVKRILESQPQVSSASVNLTTETAVVWATPEVKGMENWQQQLGEKLAKHLTSCGFNSNLRDRGYIEGDLHS